MDPARASSRTRRSRTTPKRRTWTRRSRLPSRISTATARTVRGRRVTLTVVTLALLATVVSWLVLGTPLLDTPERHVARYLGATARGDGVAAMDEWAIYVSATDSRFYAPKQLVDR